MFIWHRLEALKIYLLNNKFVAKELHTPTKLSNYKFKAQVLVPVFWQ